MVRHEAMQANRKTENRAKASQQKNHLCASADGRFTAVVPTAADADGAAFGLDSTSLTSFLKVVATPSRTACIA